MLEVITITIATAVVVVPLALRVQDSLGDRTRARRLGVLAHLKSAAVSLVSSTRLVIR